MCDQPFTYLVIERLTKWTAAVWDYCHSETEAEQKCDSLIQRGLSLDAEVISTHDFYVQGLVSV